MDRMIDDKSKTKKIDWDKLKPLCPNCSSSDIKPTQLMRRAWNPKIKKNKGEEYTKWEIKVQKEYECKECKYRWWK